MGSVTTLTPPRAPLLRFRRGFGSRLWERNIEGLSLLVDHGGVVHQELQGLPSGQLRAYRLETLAAFDLFPQLGRFAPCPLSQSCDFGLDLVVAGDDLLGRHHRPQRQIGLDGLGRLEPDVGDELVLRDARWPSGTARPWRPAPPVGG